MEYHIKTLSEMLRAFYYISEEKILGKEIELILCIVLGTHNIVALLNHAIKANTKRSLDLKSFKRLLSRYLLGIETSGQKISYLIFEALNVRGF